MSTGARMTIVYNKVSDAIDFYMDNAGIDLLIGTLQSLKVDGDHLHLQTRSVDAGGARRLVLSLASGFYRDSLDSSSIILARSDDP